MLLVHRAVIMQLHVVRDESDDDCKETDNMGVARNFSTDGHDCQSTSPFRV